MLEDLTLSRSNFTLEVTQPITLSEFTGSTLRGAFGTMLRKTVCAQRYLEDCKECYLKNCCAYAAIFTPGNLPGSNFSPVMNNFPVLSPFI